VNEDEHGGESMKLSEPLGRIDQNESVRQSLLPYCRLKQGDVWIDEVSGHRVSVGDATKGSDVSHLFYKSPHAKLAIQDPPYNIIVGNENTEQLFSYTIERYLEFSYNWVKNMLDHLDKDSNLYIWLGADQKDHFQPLPEFMLMMRQFTAVKSRSLITMRNQRGYGTQKNWMSIRQECLYYTIGNPVFNIEAEYTDIPKILKGYYKKINGELLDNTERSKSDTIRAGNVWVDIQQVFYRLAENVPGCYAQKPLRAIERIVVAGSEKGDTIMDLFSHSGTTLIAAERLKRKAFLMDIDPVFAELTIRRLEHYRKSGQVGFQCKNPFPEIEDSFGSMIESPRYSDQFIDDQQLSFL